MNVTLYLLRKHTKTAADTIPKISPVTPTAIPEIIETNIIWNQCLLLVSANMNIYLLR